MNSENPTDSELQALIEGSLEPDRFDELQEQMKTDPALLNRYLAAVRTNHLLEENYRKDSSEKIVSFSNPRRVILYAAAALVMLSLLISQLLKPDSNVATSTATKPPSVEFTPNAVFETSNPKASQDGRLQEGESVAMRDGFVSIKLPSGVEAIIESPSNFAIVSDNRLKLDRGRGWFRVPEQAVGFTVDLPWLEAVDLGTVFSTEANDDINRVRVDQGRVRVTSPDKLTAPRELTAGEMLTITRNGDISFTSGETWLDPETTLEAKSIFHDRLSLLPNQPFPGRAPLTGQWQVVDGSPSITDGKFDAGGEPALIFGTLEQPVEPGDNAVVLVSFSSKSPANFFHSKGWAGVSLFNGDHECFFLGDKSSDSYSWTLNAYGSEKHPGQPDVPRYDLPIQGSEETFTVRYHQATGEIEVFRGWGIRGVPVVKGKTDANLRFDRIRVASGKGGDFSFDEIEVKVTQQRKP